MEDRGFLGYYPGWTQSFFWGGIGLVLIGVGGVYQGLHMASSLPQTGTDVYFADLPGLVIHISVGLGILGLLLFFLGLKQRLNKKAFLQSPSSTPLSLKLITWAFRALLVIGLILALINFAHSFGYLQF